MSEQDKPKECPCCGSAPQVYGMGKMLLVRCLCDIESGYSVDAIERWNKRACPKELKEAWESYKTSGQGHSQYAKRQALLKIVQQLVEGKQ